VPFHNDSEWTHTSRQQLLEHNVDEDWLDFAKEQNELKGEVLLHELEIPVEWIQHSNGDVIAPNAAQNGNSNQRNKVENHFVEHFNAFLVNDVEHDENCDMRDWHLQNKKPNKAKLSLCDARIAQRAAATKRRRSHREWL